MLELINLSITWFLVGLIWIIQIVHYPSFALIGDTNFKAYHEFHTRSISWIVAPLMTIELGLAIYLSWSNNFEWHFLFPLILVIGIWVSTMLLQIPLHSKLARDNQQSTIRQLVSTNWIRTILWTIKGFWLIWLYN